MSIIGSIRRFWWAPVIIGLLIWALLLRGNLSSARADLSAEQSAHRQSALNWTIATGLALAADLENRLRVERAQAEESRRIADDYEVRIADARARATAVGVRGQAAAADQGRRGNTPVPGVPDPARLAGEAASEDRLPAATALSAANALIATEQAIQLDELINWVEAQARLSLTEKDERND